MYISKEKVDQVLDVVPEHARCCYTGQSILAYIDDPTFLWDEVDSWQDKTDIDLFCYSTSSQAAVVQAFHSAGYSPDEGVETFKSERIRFFEPNRRFSLQTVSLKKEGMPVVNVSWQRDVEDALDCIKRFDMDYVMASMDMKTRIFADLRPKKKTVAHVNPYHQRFDPLDVEPSFWYRQFERCPKGYSRGVDTRPVALQYKKWIEHTLETGDSMLNSKTRQYAARMMEDTIAPLLAAGFTQRQAEAVYLLFDKGDRSWEAQQIKHAKMLERIDEWLAIVGDD